MTYYIFFGNQSVLTEADRECSCNDEQSMFAVFDALCTKFLVVNVYDNGAKLVRSYDNTKLMGVASSHTSLLDKWHKNCIESARWLRSGKEYEDWFAARGLEPLDPETRERKAQMYDRKAKEYAELQQSKGA